MVAGIVPHLWFDTQAKDAATFYTGIFPDAGIDFTRKLPGTPSGDAEVVSFHLAGQPFMAISAGPLFKPNPSISFFVNFDPSKDKKAREHMDATWKKLSAGGTALMPLDKYPFSERFGWIQDRFGITWQLMLTNPTGEARPTIVPSLLFTQHNAGRAEEAIQLYTSAFPRSKMGTITRWPKGAAPEKEGTVMFADFQIAGQWFAAMDSKQPHPFVFNEAISLLVRCKDQAELDAMTGKLSAVPAAEQCGWIKDQFGVSWQISPVEMETMMRDATPEQLARVTQAFLPMKRFDVAALRRAYEGAPSVRTASRPHAR